ncbi:alpha/beta hydrolase-fold protein [Sediminibacterium ginsengisoli]|uniref:Phospholipase/Carboxylesterase n=1 Tax=Sediminibacterium ginsengisoli TaxID=413434 RepID=A0A1T4MFH9_9BACT|nr:alpha/beta hydrolase-fold protein [Sediminibacterium ginsengisoli]SJZ65673.1 Phospholipase/Carboxylesterase [Sediminibacterium ginsengisoli]
MKKIACLTFLLCFCRFTMAQQQDLYQKKVYIQGKDTLRYRILYPEHYRPSKSYPLIVFMHGSGERGNDNGAQLLHGGDLFAKDKIRDHFPAIVVFPQCPKDSTWSRFKRGNDPSGFTFLTEETPPVPQLLLKNLMDSLRNNGHADRKRIYLGGLSLGAIGAYDMLIRYPNYFAAVFAICGAGNVPLLVKNAKHVPMWIFHGALDNVVLPYANRELYKAMITSGAKEVNYTEYPKANHNSWDSAFAEPKLLPWIFSNKNKKPAAP